MQYFDNMVQEGDKEQCCDIKLIVQSAILNPQTTFLKSLIVRLWIDFRVIINYSIRIVY